MDENIKAEYFKRSYFAVDGLWFVMIEKKFSFDDALEIDKNVWSVLPKIQARKIKELLNIDGSGIDNFIKAIQTRFDIEDYKYKTNLLNENHVRLIIHECPWLNIMKKSERGNLASQIADTICPTELGVWANEFGLRMETDRKQRLCEGCNNCVWDFFA